MSTSPPDLARQSRIVAQHARTSGLLGVDFVPVYASDAMSLGEGVSAIAPDRPVRVEAPEAAAPGPAPTPPPPAMSARAAEIRVAECDPSTPEEAQGQLDALRARYEKDAPHQHFVTDHTKIVFGEGDPRARLMFVGEAPGADEDRTGRPFVGRAGQLLEKMIVAMGLSRERVYICNVLKTRPPNNQTPTIEEAMRCAPYLHEQIRIVGPEVIVTLGLPASRLLLETSSTMRQMRGRWASYPPGGEFEPAEASETPGRTPVMPTYHPAFLLRSYTPENRAKVWADLRLVMERLGLGAGA